MTAILNAIAHAGEQRVDVCVFPELALTGFHRKIRELARPEIVDPWLRLIQDACARHSVAAAVGAPTFDGEGRIFNSHILVDRSGDIIGTVSKSGLTPSEETFFARGTTRPVFHLKGRRCTSVLCREVEDLPQLTEQLPSGSAEIIFWPGLIGRAPKSPLDHEAVAHIEQARALASRLSAFVIQANWPNSLNYPEEGSHAGQSVVIDPTGRILLQLPRAESGLAVFTLGEPAHVWLMEDA